MDFFPLYSFSTQSVRILWRFDWQKYSNVMNSIRIFFFVPRNGCHIGNPTTKADVDIVGCGGGTVAVAVAPL